MIRFKARPKICEKEEHENIDVLCNLLGDEKNKWEDRVCIKCRVPERLQDNKEYIKSLNDAEEYLRKVGMIADD